MLPGNKQAREAMIALLEQPIIETELYFMAGRKDGAYKKLTMITVLSTTHPEVYFEVWQHGVLRKKTYSLETAVEEYSLLYADVITEE